MNATRIGAVCIYNTCAGGSVREARDDPLVRKFTIQRVAGSEWFTELMATVPQSQTLRRASWIKVVILSTPTTATRPEIEALCRSGRRVCEIRMNESRFRSDSDVASRLSRTRPICFGAGPTGAGCDLEGISKQCNRYSVPASATIELRSLGTAQCRLGEHRMTADNRGRLDAPVPTDFHLQFNIAGDVGLPCQGRITRLERADHHNFSLCLRVGRRSQTAQRE